MNTTNSEPDSEDKEGIAPIRDPSTLNFQANGIRRRVLASYWIVIVLAFPLWWWTTSIERLSLPSSRVFTQTNRDLRFPVHIELDATEHNADAVFAAEQLQALINEQNLRAPHRWKGIDVHVSSKMSNSMSIS